MLKIRDINYRLRNLLLFNESSKFKYVVLLIFYLFAIFLWGIPAAIVQRMIHIKLKVGILPTNYIGHFIYEVDKLLNSKEINEQKVFFASQSNISNYAFFSVVKKRFKILPRFVILPIYIANKILFDKSNKYIVKLGSPVKIDQSSFQKKWFEFDSTENFDLKKFFPSYDESKPLICFFLRQQINDNNYTLINSSSYRNVTLDNYFPLFRSLANDFNLINMGRGKKDSVDDSANEIFSYLNSKLQSDVNDLILTSMSDICVTTDSGSVMIPLLFQRKIVQTNLSLHGYFSGPSSTLFLLKHHRCLKSGQLLTFRQLIDLGIQEITDQYKFDNLKIQVVENSLEELLELGLEIKSLYDGSWKPSKTNELIYDKIHSRYTTLNPPSGTFFPNYWVSKNLWFFD